VFALLVATAWWYFPPARDSHTRKRDA